MRPAMGVAFFGAVLFGATVFAAPRGPARPKMLVQDLAPKGVEAGESAVISTAACQAFAKTAVYEVLCGEDIRNLIRLRAMAAAFDGCQDEKCALDLGRAMKARYVVSGSVGKVGTTYVLQLSIFDAEQARAVGRAELKADTIEKLYARVPEAVGAARSFDRGG